MPNDDSVQLYDSLFALLISADQVAARVRELGAMLEQRYGDKQPIFISILSGAFVFAADLIRAFRAPCEVSFVKLSSYEGMQSSGVLQTVLGIDTTLEHRHVIVVEDIVDTGRTLHFFLAHLRAQQPASLCTVTFLRKPTAALFPVEVDFVGFDIPNRFVVGYGLDYNGLGRNLPGIYQLAEKR
ncbi:MAG: hypoxanthine phosphoribosyltransferase [Saprospiraceae bacterium]|nr:hypoxanthine phosphoribosyltransferase [Saprospiraceae bacterium]MDW8483286.1 hypoxanthine phosphoribosyltransferase [Saprospiraceae bacterium]